MAAEAYAIRLARNVDDVWVDIEHRRHGLCKCMVRDLLEFFRERDAERVVLNYMPGNLEAR